MDDVATIEQDEGTIGRTTFVGLVLFVTSISIALAVIAYLSIREGARPGPGVTLARGSFAEQMHEAGRGEDGMQAAQHQDINGSGAASGHMVDGHPHGH